MKYLLVVSLIALVACNKSSNSAKTFESTENWWTEEERQLIVSELNRTTMEIQFILKDLTDVQWYFKEDSGRWSIAEIIEHLEMQNQLHFREILVTSKAPQYLTYRTITINNDEYFTKYATDSTKGTAQWYLEPLGRFCDKEAGESAFLRAREHLTGFVSTTKIDLRKQFTFRTTTNGKEISQIRIGEVRDLHQLLLTGIAHTDRHLLQIRNITNHPNFPK